METTLKSVLLHTNYKLEDIQVMTVCLFNKLCEVVQTASTKEEYEEQKKKKGISKSNTKFEFDKNGIARPIRNK